MSVLKTNQESTPGFATGRPFRSAIPKEALETIQAGSLTYTYKGIEMIKNPFDLALYMQLIWREKPATILELGSNKGGSALWFADQMMAFGLRPNVISIDINPVPNRVAQAGVHFLIGDANDLAQLLSDELLDRLPRPWFIVEDSSHLSSTSRRVLDYFHPKLRPGEYIVVEDGIVTDLGMADRFDGGPSAAVAAFLADHPGAYEIDSLYCDYFGYNFTYNVNGYLRRTPAV
jgi:cephalosporin hydroxylase